MNDFATDSFNDAWAVRVRSAGGDAGSGRRLSDRFTKRIHDIFGRDFDPDCGGTLKDKGLLLSGYAPRSLPALHGTRCFTEQFGGLPDASKAFEQGGVGVHSDGCTIVSHIQQRKNRTNIFMQTGRIRCLDVTGDRLKALCA